MNYIEELRRRMVSPGFHFTSDDIPTVRALFGYCDSLHDQWRHQSDVTHRLILRLVDIQMCLKPDGIHTPDGKIYDYHPPDDIVRLSWEMLTKSLKALEEESLLKISASSHSPPQSS